jgi:hypothetical protein
MQDIDTSVQFGQSFQFRAAAHAGMSVGSYQNLMRTDPAKAQSIVDQMTTKGIDNAIGASAVVWIKRRAAEKYGGAEGLANDPNLLVQLANDYQEQFRPPLIRLMQVIKNTTGVSIEEGQVTRWVVGHVMGLNASGKLAQKTTSESDIQGGKPITGGGLADTGGLAAAGSGNTGHDSSGPGGRRLSAAQQSYNDLAQSKGNNYHSPVIERMLSRVKDTDKTKVIVNTKDGPRMVTMAEAIKYFPNEVAGGQIHFVGGAEQGKSFKDVVGVEGDMSEARGQAAAYESTHYNSKVGTKIDPNSDLYKKAMGEEAAAAAAGAGTTMVDLTPEAKKLLTLVPSPSGTSGDAATGSRPDPNSNVVGDYRMGRR